MKSLTKKFLVNVAEKNIFQEKALSKEIPNLSQSHLAGLENLLSFFCSDGLSIEKIAESYLNFVEYFLEERKYFYRQGSYRYSSYAETAQLYNDKKYMESYMIGLSLSVYLLKLQRDNMDFFILHCKAMPVTDSFKLLEVGTGHGAYFIAAMQNTSFENYLGIDISPTSVAITKRYADFCIKDEKKDFSVVEKDFFAFDGNDEYDMIVMGEILEHVEQPLDFLKKAVSIAKKNTKIYVSTAINSPFPDHIYLFKTVDEVRELFKQAELAIVDEIIIPPEGVPLEKAISKKYDIVVAYILQTK